MKDDLVSSHCGEFGLLSSQGISVSIPLRQKSQGPSHLTIAEGSLLLRCLWKVGIPLQSKPGNQLSSRDDLGCTVLSSNCSAEIGVPLDLRRVSQGISGVA